MSRTPIIDEICTLIDERKAEFVAASDEIWSFAELRYQETRSSALQASILRGHGFTVMETVAGIPTAFVAEAGAEGPVIAFLGEFDALANLSQKAGAAQAAPVAQGHNGHGCGHNLLGCASMLAAVTVAKILKAHNLPGRVRYYGCPAEEGGSGKTFMARAGVFDDVDVAITWHPAPFTGVRSTTNLANIQAYFNFVGESSHASNAPHLGRSALDALELMNIGVNFLREHMPSDCRIHYAITDTGGISPNVVQSSASALYLVRAPELPMVQELFERVRKVAEGAAMMTGTSVTVDIDRACSNLLPNTALEMRMHENLLRLGPVSFDEDDRAFAAAIRATLSDTHISSSLKLYNAKGDALTGKVDAAAPLHEGILAFDGESHFRPGSTDVGDVSWIVPTVQCWTACWVIGTPGHSWQVVAQGKSAHAHKALVHAAKAMVMTGYDLFTDEDLLPQAVAEHSQRTGGLPYVCPIPADVPLPFMRR